MTPAERAADLRRQIDHHNRRYYRDDAPEISDREFDRLLEELKQIEAEHPETATPDSPTQRVGGVLKDDLPAVVHRLPMLSIDNTYSAGELKEFDRSIRGLLGGEEIDYVVELKIDGVAISLTYENGILTVGATRGDGERGENVTRNVRTIKQIPIRLRAAAPPLFEVRGEVYMERAELVRLNDEIASRNSEITRLNLENPKKQKRTAKLYDNPRNLASGTLKLDDPAECAKRKLKMFAYSLGVVEGVQIRTHVECLKTLEEFGFPVNPDRKACANIDEVIEYCNSWAEKRRALPYETDGMVIKVNDYARRERVGYTSKFPRWARAYKFAAEQAMTRIDRIEVQVGRTGKLTPVAWFEPPVRLAGTTVRKASLHNADNIKEKDIRIGDTVVVEKAGEIIPQVVRIEASARTGNERIFRFPKQCPICGAPARQEEDSPFVVCTAPRDRCGGQLKRQIEQYARRTAMDIDGLGESLVDQLVDTGLVRGIPDLYQLAELPTERLSNLERFERKSAENLLKQIDESKDRGLSRLLSGLGIEMVADSTADLLATEFGTMEELRNATIERLAEIKGIGPERAKSIHDWFHSEQGKELIDELNELGVKMEEPKKAAPAGASGAALAGKTIVVTGTLTRYGRDEIELLIRQLGGKPASSVSKKTDYVLAGEKAGSKLDKAKELGVKVISEEEFDKMIGKE